MLKELQTLEGHSDRVWTLAWNPAGTLLASSGADKTIRLWAKDHSDNWNCSSVLTGSHNKSIRRICWSPCGSYIASASFDSTVCIWKRSSVDGSWTTVVNLEGHESEIKGVAWSSDGTYLASCGRDRTIWIWERVAEENDESNMDDLDGAENWDCSDVKNDHSKDVKFIVWHPHYPLLVSCSYDDTVKFFHRNGDDWTCFQTLTAHTSTVWSADFSASGQYLATCSDDKTVRIWMNHAHDKLPQVESNSWKCVSVIQGYHSRSIFDVSWSKVDDIIASASGDNALALHGKRSSESHDNGDIFVCVDKINQSHDCDVNSVTWNPKTPGLLASGSDDRRIKLWKYEADDKGMQPLTVVDELMLNLSQASIETNKIVDNSSTKLDQEPNRMKDGNLSLKVNTFNDLTRYVATLLQLKQEVFQDVEKNALEKLLDLKFTKSSTSEIGISELQFDEDSNVNNFTIEIDDTTERIRYKFYITVDRNELRLKFPRRSVKLSVVNKYLFLIEKTGDLFQVLPSGTCKFLLGHLFMFSDVKFITEKHSGDIIYILTTDRDEKIRISRWPDTFEIERFCFGHKHILRRILVVDEDRFVSIDQHDEVCVWNLNDIGDGNHSKPLHPEKKLTFDDNARKRLCIR